MLKIVKKRILVALGALLVVCLLSAVAHAQGSGGVEESWQHYLLTTVWSILGVVLTASLPIIIPKLLKLLHLQVSATTNDEIQEIVSDAVTYAQHWVQTQIDAKLPPTPEQVQSVTMQFIVQQIKARNLPDQVATFLENLIKTRLANTLPHTEPSFVPAAKVMQAAYFRG